MNKKLMLEIANSRIKLYEKWFGKITKKKLEEIIIKPYQLTGYLEIDVKNAPVNTSTRYRIVGLPNLGYEAGRRSRSGISKLIGAIFNPADFLNNLFKKKSAQY